MTNNKHNTHLMKCTQVMLRYGIFVAMLSAPGIVSAQGLFQKAVGKVAKLSGKMMGGASGLTGTTSDLESVTPSVIYRTNLYPKKVGAMELALFGKGWKDGGDGVLVQFTKKHGIKMTKLEGGGMTVNGVAADFQDLGVYTQVSEHADAPKKVAITASNGEKSSFTLSPEKPIKLVSINGKTGDNMDVDITKDVVLEFENPGPADGTLMQISISASIIGLNTFYEVGSFKPATKVTIPADAFRHISFPSKNGKSLSFNSAYLQIARTSIKYATDVSGQYKKIPYTLATLDGRFINIGSKPDFFNGLVSEGKVKSAGLSYKFEKPVAHNSRPFAQAKTIGVAAFGIRGTSAVEKTEKNKLMGITTETSVSFNPSNQVLDAILAKLYPDVVNVTQSVFGATIVPIEKMATIPTWKASGLMSETNDGTETSFARPYKVDKILSDAALKVDGYRVAADQIAIGTDANVDALLRCVVDMVIKIENGNSIMTPVLHYSLYGRTNGVGLMPTIYTEGTITGQSATVGSSLTDNDIIALVNAPEMAKALRTALTDLKAQEATESGYQLLWSLQ